VRLQKILGYVDPRSVKKIDNLTVFFTLLGSASVKAVRRMLMKLKKIDNLTVFFTLLGSASVKAVRRMLMKLSPGDTFKILQSV